MLTRVASTTWRSCITSRVVAAVPHVCVTQSIVSFIFRWYSYSISTPEQKYIAAMQGFSMLVRRHGFFDTGGMAIGTGDGLHLHVWSEDTTLVL